MYPRIQWRQLSVHFRALASPTRLQIVERLSERGELSVKELAASVRMSQPRVSWHLTLLRRGGAVRTRKEGRQVYCSVDQESIRRHQLALWDLLNERTSDPDANPPTEELIATYGRQHAQSERSEQSAAAAQD
jgi:DNA-binding transcriptional ArsR family regulator